MFEKIAYNKIEKETPPEDYADLAAAEALDKIKDDFENRENDKENLPFHNSMHTERVINRVDLILDAVEEANPELVSPQTKTLGKIAASFHDTFQEWEEKDISNGQFSKTIRKRFSGKNEKKSGNQAIEFMEKTNIENGAEIFSEKDKNVVNQAINTTVADYNTDKKTVFQPSLNEKSSVVARALALADIGAAGIDGPIVFSEEGDALFKEENLDIFEASRKNNNIPENLKEYYRQRMIDWSKFQPQFARGRKELLEKELTGLPKQSQEKLSSLFGKFDASIRIAGQRAQNREKMSFEELLVDMKFK